MNCPNCNKEVEQGVAICPFCNRQMIKCPMCGTLLPDSVTKCTLCHYQVNDLVIPKCRYCSDPILDQKFRELGACQSCWEKRLITYDIGSNSNANDESKESESPRDKTPKDKSKGKKSTEGGSYIGSFLQKLSHNGDIGKNRKKFLPVLFLCAAVIGVGTWVTQNRNIYNDISSNKSDMINNWSEYITQSYADQRELYGNSFQNISEGGTIVANDGWVYYTASNSDNSIWRMRPDGSEIELFEESPSVYLSAMNNWLYYCRFDNGYFYRKNIENGHEEQLYSEKIYEPKIVGDKIYFDVVNTSKNDEYYTLYSMNLDGTDITRLSWDNDVVFYCLVSDDRIYYLDTTKDRQGYSIDLDGSDCQCWYSNSIGSMDYVDGMIYFTDYENGGLFLLDTQTEDIQKISDDNIASINVYDGWVYYTGVSGENKGWLCKMNLEDPSETVQLVKDVATLTNVCANRVYYRVSISDNKKVWKMVSTDGSTSFEVP